MAPAKLLLFGEHTILHGGEALALPLRRFRACWREQPEATCAALFEDWAAFAKTRPALVEALDLDRWVAEAETLAVDSDIPQDYGLGSSGALTALVYRRYRRSGTEDLAIGELRTLLGELESFFHGRSSGLDPLVCTLDAAVHVDGGGVAQRVEADLPLWTPEGAWFLLDSRRPKAGGAAIAGFGESCQSHDFREAYLRPALALTQRLIAATLGSHPLGPAGIDDLREFSQLQLEHLPWLVPADLSSLWREWHQRGIAYIKLCGAGGGGYFLGYAPDRERLGGEAEVMWL